MRPNRFHSVYWHVTNYDATAPNTAILILLLTRGRRIVAPTTLRHLRHFFYTQLRAADPENMVNNQFFGTVTF